MSWALNLVLIAEPILLIFLICLIVKTVLSDSKKIENLTREMCTFISKAQAFLKHVDHEFEVMNLCAESVKTIFLNFGKVYKEISNGSKTLDEAMKLAQSNIPEELKGFEPFLQFKRGSISTFGVASKDAAQNVKVPTTAIASSALPKAVID